MEWIDLDRVWSQTSPRAVYSEEREIGRRVSSKYFGFSFSVSFYQCSILILRSSNTDAIGL